MTDPVPRRRLPCKRQSHRLVTVFTDSNNSNNSNSKSNDNDNDIMQTFLHLMTLLTVWAFSADAFAPASLQQPQRSSTAPLFRGATTMEPPTQEKTFTSNDTGDFVDDDTSNNDDYGDLEYLIDSAESREMEDPFHILLLGSTFEKPKITVHYVSGSLEYVLDMPPQEATELSKFAYQEGMSCLGTWPREECLSLGKQLQRRDIVCRVVPFVEGGQRGWQAKDASDKVGSSQNAN